MAANQKQKINPIWKIASPIPQTVEDNLAEFNPVMRQLLFNRGITTAADAENYLFPKIDYTHNSLLLKDIETAIGRLEYAIQHNQRIAIYGDYDVDGVTATAILSDYLTKHNADVICHIPNRFEEGYGVRSEAIEILKDQEVKLIITVDCGIRSVAEAEYAKSLGIDMIITDHHQPLKELPNVIAIINPKQPNDIYPFKDLAGVGVAYKFIQAYHQLFPLSHAKPEDYLDLVALGTIADMVPLMGENRILARIGLDRLRATHRPGIRALIS
ncbi:MAG: single-stranded-DNA-specific exonuclease RecJ, partial [Anaerolineales bacterium]